NQSQSPLVAIAPTSQAALSFYTFSCTAFGAFCGGTLPPAPTFTVSMDAAPNPDVFGDSTTITITTSGASEKNEDLCITWGNSVDGNQTAYLGHTDPATGVLTKSVDT